MTELEAERVGVYDAFDEYEPSESRNGSATRK